MAQMRNVGSMGERYGKLSQGSDVGRRRWRRGGCRGRQGGLCKASDGAEEERKAWKDWAPREVTEGSYWREASGRRKKQTMKKLLEVWTVPWQTQADAGKPLNMPKMKNMLKAQKALGHR
eukprot:gene15545-biopygen9689